MTITELMEKSLRVHVGKSNGASEEIEYIHKSSGVNELVKCYPQKDAEMDTTSSHIANKVVFHALFLQEKPMKNDIIVYNGISWKVEEVEFTSGSHNVKAYETKHSLGVRR